MSACPAPEGQLADGRLRLAARPVRQPPAPIVEERQEEHHRPRFRYEDAALFPAAAGHTSARVSTTETELVARGAPLQLSTKAVAAALRLARYLTKPIYSENGRFCGGLGTGAA